MSTENHTLSKDEKSSKLLLNSRIESSVDNKAEDISLKKPSTPLKHSKIPTIKQSTSARITPPVNSKTNNTIMQTQEMLSPISAKYQTKTSK